MNWQNGRLLILAAGIVVGAGLGALGYSRVAFVAHWETAPERAAAWASEEMHDVRAERARSLFGADAAAVLSDGAALESHVADFKARLSEQSCGPQAKGPAYEYRIRSAVDEDGGLKPRLVATPAPVKQACATRLKMSIGNTEPAEPDESAGE